MSIESPYSEEETRWWADAIEAESSFLAEPFGVAADEHLRVRLVPVRVEGTGDLGLDLVRAHALAQHVDVGPSTLVVSVPEGGLADLDATLARTDVVRHELSHALLAHALGERLPRWLHEGVAAVVEGGMLVDGRFVPGVVPPDAVFALRDELPAELDEMFGWGAPSRDELADPARTQRRSRLALGFVWHALLTRTGSFRARLADVAHASSDALHAEADAFVAWARGLDATECVRVALESDDADRRASAMQRLCRWMTDPQHADTRTPAFVARAVELLDDPRAGEAAGRFLVLVRPTPGHDEALVDGLLASDDPTHVLVGSALRVRAGGDCDTSRVGVAWGALAVTERTRLASVASVLDLHLVPERTEP
ncbi:MAG: hypothetical protein H6825_01800 [Planctomycetes bacterium]|nr:hypothetical protein [Planctomycetota bacterium]